MKKNIKLLAIGLIGFVLSLNAVSAKEIKDLNTLGNDVLAVNKKAEGFYLVGEYAFTTGYKTTVQDVMLAARSIQAKDQNGKINTDGIFKEMTIYTIDAQYNNSGEIDSWKIGKSLYGDNTLEEDLKSGIQVKYIDYQYLKENYTITFEDPDGGNATQTVSALEGDTIKAPEGFVREGYKLMGWYETDPETLFNFEETPITGNLKLSAKWSKLPEASTTLPTTSTVGAKAQEYTVTMDKANEFAGKMVYGHFSVTRDGENARDLVVIQYYETASGINDWYILEGDDFGPKDTGFPLTEGLTSQFKINFKEAGTYHAVIEVRDKATDEVYITIEKDVVVSPVQVDAETMISDIANEINGDASINTTYKVATESDTVTVTVSKNKLDTLDASAIEATLTKIKNKLMDIKDYIESASIVYTDAEGEHTISSWNDLASWVLTLKSNKDLVEIGTFKITVNLYEKYAEFTDNKTTKEFTLIVEPEKVEITPSTIFDAVKDMSEIKDTYDVSYVGDAVTVKVESSKVNSALEGTLMEAIATKIQGLGDYKYIKSAKISFTDLAGQEKSFTNWSDLLAWILTIKTNRDLVGIEFKISVTLDEIYSEFSDKTTTKDFTLNVTADKTTVDIQSIVDNTVKTNSLNPDMYTLAFNGEDKTDIKVTIQSGKENEEIKPGEGTTGIKATIDEILAKNNGIKSISLKFGELTFEYDRNTEIKDIVNWLAEHLAELAKLGILSNGKLTNSSLIGKTIELVVNLDERFADNAKTVNANPTTYSITFQKTGKNIFTKKELENLTTTSASKVKAYNVSVDNENNIIHVNYTADNADQTVDSIIGGSGLFLAMQAVFEDTDVQSITIGGSEITFDKVEAAVRGELTDQLGIIQPIATALGLNYMRFDSRSANFTLEKTVYTNAEIAADVAKAEQPIKITFNLKEGSVKASDVNLVYTIEFGQA